MNLRVLDIESLVAMQQFKCVKCCRLQGRPGEQKMEDLPVHSLADTPPFTYCRINMFGQFVIKQQFRTMQSRNEIKHQAMSSCAH